ncbi:hypothetical protein IW261DRAFT_1416383 [Armillaria novae-zelandiae]|uniref:Uncharacterized protein n=1 Tax=Armillaria novae-zelandiae TaxID=153914 RepID=A0AA39UIS9_9AGAR|nr:hypothetical protein IW261DRAFT_1416383 [Armillaria novae-zelandiae]
MYVSRLHNLLSSTAARSLRAKAGHVQVQDWVKLSTRVAHETPSFDTPWFWTEQSQLKAWHLFLTSFVINENQLTSAIWWLSEKHTSTHHSPSMDFVHACRILENLQWTSTLPKSMAGTSMLILTTFCGDKWLTDEHMLQLSILPWPHLITQSNGKALVLTPYFFKTMHSIFLDQLDDEAYRNLGKQGGILNIATHLLLEANCCADEHACALIAIVEYMNTDMHKSPDVKPLPEQSLQMADPAKQGIPNVEDAVDKQVKTSVTENREVSPRLSVTPVKIKPSTGLTTSWATLFTKQQAGDTAKDFPSANSNIKD